ncbi:MAG TPA: acyltransferase [Telluria sp.]|nr:acyltransferase [Telluria sp.]
MHVLALVRRAWNAVYNRYLIVRDPVRYARKAGVRVGEGVRFYGMTPGMFGSEPWLISIGNNVHIVSGCNFINHDGGVLILRHRFPDLEITKPIRIGNNVYIGINCTILPGVTIGDNVIIGAGAVVTRDIPSGSVAAGIPARVIKTLDQYLASVQAQSLGYGHLGAAAKDLALRQHYKDWQ